MSDQDHTPFVSPDTALPVPNVPLLRKVREHIGAHPEQWDQLEWRTETPCGTAYCFAGWAVLFDGGQWADPGGAPSYLTSRDDDPADHICVDGTVDIESRAARILGLRFLEAACLFGTHQHLPGIDAALFGIYARAGERP